MIQIIFGAGALNLLIGVLVLVQSKRSKEIISFGVFCLATGIWGLSNFLVYYYNSGAFLESAYAFGALVASSMLAWSFVYRRSDMVWKWWFTYFVGAFIFVLSYIDGYFIGNIRGITASGVDASPGIFSDEYALFVLLALVWSIINVISVYRKSFGIEKNQVRLILVGLIGFVGVTIVVSAILPIFGILEYTNLDSPSSLIFVVFVAFAMVRHRFLGTKVVLAQILVGALIIMSILQLLDASGVFDFVIAMISLVVVLVLGTFLLRSVFNDLRQKEELQRINTQLERSKRKLALANEHLKIMDQTKTDFINIASHQLRTPLGGMRWSMEMLLAGEVGQISDEAKETVRQNLENNQRMVALVNDLLNVARIEQGRMKETPESTDIVSILDEAVKTMEPEAGHRNVALKLDVLSKDIPPIMIARKHFFEAIQNLVSNAIKYNRPKGTVTVSVQASQRSVRISVADTGMGIPKSEQPKIFSKFFRAGNALATDVEGTGLGLFVAKSFVEEGGGIVRFKSQEGVGTTFFIELPLMHHSVKSEGIL